MNTPPCAKCKYYKKYYLLAFEECLHPQNLIKNPVSGQVITQYLISDFKTGRTCCSGGCKGNLFEPRLRKKVLKRKMHDSPAK